MNDIINKFLIGGDKIMPEMHLKDPNVGTYSACGPFTKHKKRIQKFMETGDTNCIYKKKLEHNQRRTQSDKVLNDKASRIASNPRYNGYERGIVSMVYKFFDKKSK